MAIINGLITIDEAKRSLNINTQLSTADETDLEEYIEAATPVIEEITGPILPATKTFWLDGGASAIRLPFPFRSVSSVTVDDAPYSGYVAIPGAGVIRAVPGLRFSAGSRNVAVTVNVGRDAVPPNVKLAARELVRHWWQLGKQATRGYAPGSDDGEGGSGSGQTGFAVPRRVTQLLAPDALIGGFA